MDVVNEGGIEESALETPAVEPTPTPSPLEPGGVRFEQVYGKMKDYEAQVNQYKELGDAAEMRRIKEEHAQWKRALEEYKSQAARTPDEKAEAERAMSIRRELLKVYPELERVNTVSELMKQVEELRSNFSEQTTRATLQQASDAFSEVLKANKIDLKYQGKLEEYIAHQMSDEDKRAFLSGDFSVAEKIFLNELNEGLFAGLKSQPSLQKPPMRNTAGGTPPGAQAQKPKTLKEAESEAFSRLGLK